MSNPKKDNRLHEIKSSRKVKLKVFGLSRSSQKRIKIHETFVKFPLTLSKMFPLSESLVSNKEELFFLRNQGGRTGNRCNAPNKYVTNL